MDAALKEHRDLSESAADIAVKGFRQIFHWPLSLLEPEGSKPIIERLARSVGEVWSDRQPDPTYEEIVYFHDFVQDFLYDNPSDKSSDHWRFKRDDIRTLKLSIGGRETCFAVDRLWLDLFSFGVAIVTLEIRSTESLTLARTQTLIDHARRAFPGYWNEGIPGLCPVSATLGNGAGEERHLVAEPEALLRNWRPAPRKRPLPRIFPWWRELAAPLRLVGEPRAPGDPDSPEWRHVLDERIPVMSWVALDTPAGMDDSQALLRVSEGDWFRLAGADEAGESAYPYNRDFLKAQAPTLFYDRFMADGRSKGTVRQAFAGYHHMLVGTGWFFENIIVKHFACHYRQMNFIAQLEFATLLTFSRRVTDLVRSRPERPDFARMLQTIRGDVLDFTHCYHFTHVSNHLQAREMNEMLRRSLDLDALRRDVDAEIQAAAEFAFASEQAAQTESQSLLTEVATLFLPGSLAAGLSGMNVVTGFSQFEGASRLSGIAELAAWTFVSYGALALFLLCQPRNGSRARQRMLPWIGGIAMAAFTVAALCGIEAVGHSSLGLLRN